MPACLFVYTYAWAPTGFFPEVGKLRSGDESPPVVSRDEARGDLGAKPQKPTTGRANNA